MWKDIPGNRLVVPPDNEVKREILWVWHEHKGGGIEGGMRQLTDQPPLFLATSEALGGTICERVCRVPAEQEPYAQSLHPTLQNHCPRERTPFTQIMMDLIMGLPRVEALTAY